MAERWKIRRTDAGWHVVFLAANGEPMLSSEVYTTSETAHDAIKTVENLIIRNHREGETLAVEFSDDRTAHG